jgi:hypothetical protein
MNTKHDTVDLLLVVALEVAEAVLVLAVALVAVVLTVARWRPAAAPARVMAPPAPAPALHPLALVAEQLEALPVSRLRPLAGVTSKRHRKHQLIAMVTAMAC